MNVPNEVIESSEHGVVSGPRKTTCKCGWANRNPARIIFGVETNENEYPWMVLLNTYHTMSNGMRIMFYCGGSIITKKHVLTAAHCVVNKYTNKVALPGDVTVILAEHDSSKDSGKEKSYEVETVFVHENYLLQQSHDIALLHLKNDIEFNDIIGPVCLYPDELPVVNRHIKIMGWGRTEGGQGSNVLLKSYSTVIDNQLCEGASSFEICTFIKPGSTCSGDSGGPLVWLDPETNRYAQVSLVSRGHPDCQSSPTISTQISSFYNWIVERIKLTDPSAETCQKI
uniref:Venom S1 protease 27 n=1 Tax=Oncocephalus sp. TaxID=2944721 RepID=A0AB38ZET0_9HEMI